ncbi:MAG TPA: FtsX-like permease family protein, partial [Pirellulaceae bacterium]|nr:FtsX-like permease family protein [Pirellulaceae bacterium]
MTKTPLAWHNLWHQPVRSGVAVIGVTFAAVLMFMQLGFLEAVKASATVIYDVLQFDICLRSRDYDRFSDARSFDRSRLSEAQEIEGVATVTPLWAGVLSWRNPHSGEPRAILSLGVPDSAVTFKDRALQGVVDRALDHPQAMLVDTLTRREFGPADRHAFGPADIGQRVEINNKQLEIAGLYTCGSGLNAGGAVIVHQRDFLRCLPQFMADHVSLGLIDVAPGSDPYAVARRLESALPEDVEVLTRSEVLGTEIRHWVWETNYGLIFLSGVVVAVVVGTAIVYQVLASEVTSRMPEYATLKAMGYDNAYLVRVMVEQSLLLALVAFAVSWAIAAVLYEI